MDLHGRLPGKQGNISAFYANDLPLIPRQWIVAAIGLSSLVLAVLMIRARLTINPMSLGSAAFVMIAGGLAGLRHATRRQITLTQSRLHDMAETSLMLFVTIAMGGVASYVAAAETHGYSDAILDRADQVLGFNWLWLYGVVTAHPWLQRLGQVFYDSIYVSPLVVLGYLAWHGHRGHARRFVLVAWIAITLTLLLFPLFPAKGALDYLWQGGAVPYLPREGFGQDIIIEALRDRTLTTIDLAALRGVVCAPSFHTVCAVVFIVTAWPLKALRWVIVPVNLAMLAATPVEGAHYLVDMLVGVLVALIAVAIARQVSAWHDRAQPNYDAPDWMQVPAE